MHQTDTNATRTITHDDIERGIRRARQLRSDAFHKFFRDTLAR